MGLEKIFSSKLLLAVVFIFAGVLLFGCASTAGNANNAPISSQDSGNPSPAFAPGGPNGGPNGSGGFGPGGFGNRSFNGSRSFNASQMQAQMKLLVDACNGKADGDACIVSSTRGDRNGTCAAMNGSLACRMAMPRFRGNGSNNYPGGGPQ